MGTRRAKPLPPVVVVIREGQPTPGQAAAWERLWAALLSPDREKPPAGQGRGQGKGKEK